MDNKDPLENFVEDLVSVCDYISIVVKKKKDWTRLHEIIYLTGMYIHHRQDACRERLDGCEEDALYYEREARKVAERLRSFLPK